jgi:hypothetical protein
MSEPWMAVLGAVIGENRWAPERVAGLSRAEREVYGSVVQSFVDGRVPDAVWLQDRRKELERLVDRDLVGVDRDGAVMVAYPFSARPTRHRVRSGHGRRYWAMCAIDALGIPFLLGRRAEIDAREPDSERMVTVVVDPLAGTVIADPPDATVVAARAGDGCVARCACPHINLFGSPAGAERYLAAPELRGVVLTVAEAAAAGGALFGGLHDVVASAPSPEPVAVGVGRDRSPRSA